MPFYKHFIWNRDQKWNWMYDFGYTIFMRTVSLCSSVFCISFQKKGMWPFVIFCYCCFWVLVGIEIRFKEIWCWKAMAAHINDLKYLKLAKTNKSAFWSFLFLSEVFMQASLESRICLLFTVLPFLFLKMLLSIWKSWLFRF